MQKLMIGIISEMLYMFITWH